MLLELSPPEENIVPRGESKPANRDWVRMGRKSGQIVALFCPKNSTWIVQCGGEKAGDMYAYVEEKAGPFFLSPVSTPRAQDDFWQEEKLALIIFRAMKYHILFPGGGRERAASAQNVK